MPEFRPHADTPFPVGVEYYRAPMPRTGVWDGDFARIQQAGLRIVRSFSYWNWMEPGPGVYQLDDFDRLFDLAGKHGLSVWMDITLATHGACPEWLLREHPDMRTVSHRGEPSLGDASPATPQGAMVHCCDHPAWRERGGALLRHVVGRYRDRPNLLVWGLWDGVSPSWPRHGEGLPCYCEHTRARYKAWLREGFTLEELNTRVLRRYRDWADVEPPRSNHNVVEMLLYLRFHRLNLVDHLRWMVAEARRIDPLHEVRAHAASTPRPWDEECAREVDSWGMSMSSNNLLTSEDPYQLADRAFSFDLSRSQGVKGRWWNEEIYAGMSPGGVTWKKQSDPRELTTLLWMTLAGGAAGCMFWQYRPEYLSFESPGYNLAALDGRPTERLRAVAAAVDRIEGMKDHLPLECPPAEVGIVYHPESQELFGLNGRTERFNADLRGVYRTLWRHGIPADILSPRMDWSGYRLLFLPNLALMGGEVRQRIGQTLEESPETRLVAEGSFGLYQENGLSSEAPPEGLSRRLGVRVEDFSAVTPADIRRGENLLETPWGRVPVTTPCGYAVLEPQGDSTAVARLGGRVVAVRSGDGRFTWYGLTLSAGFGDVGHPRLVLGLVEEAGIRAPVAVAGSRLVTTVRGSRQGGRLIFAFNIEPASARATLRPACRARGVRDLLTGREVEIEDGAFEVGIEAWSVGVFHCEDA